MKKISLFLALICVLALIPGCADKTPVLSEEPAELDYLMLDVTKCESALELTVKGCDAFEGVAERIKATDISGGIISEVSTCADFGDFFSGWYSIEGIGAKSARYILQPEGKQKWETARLGINYYSLILDAAFFDAESVEIEHGSDISIYGLIGDFEFMVFVLGRDNDDEWFIGEKMTTIAGSLDTRGDVSLSNNGGEYIISSTSTIFQLAIEGSDGYGNVTTQTQAETEGDSYVLTYNDGRYVLTDRE